MLGVHGARAGEKFIESRIAETALVVAARRNVFTSKLIGHVRVVAVDKRIVRELKLPAVDRAAGRGGCNVLRDFERFDRDVGSDRAFGLLNGAAEDRVAGRSRLDGELKFEALSILDTDAVGRRLRPACSFE